ncbi:MAG TPA: (2Fe-2S)-binding protein [Acidobacteriota bacterium]|nr:(2Fe-2S)-binding protein [Acidobacteriota bacterium]
MPGGLRLDDVDRAEIVRFSCDGEIVEGRRGETIGVALLAAGRRTLRITPRRNEPRGLFCAMGVCFDCLVEVDGRAGLRACLIPIREGMVVKTRSMGSGTE